MRDHLIHALSAPKWKPKPKCSISRPPVHWCLMVGPTYSASCHTVGRVGLSWYQVLPGRYQVRPGNRYQPRAPVHQMARSTGVTPCSRSPGDQVGRVYSRAPGDLVNGGTVLDTWYRGTKPVSAGVSYLVPWALKHGVRY